MIAHFFVYPIGELYVYRFLDNTPCEQLPAFIHSRRMGWAVCRRGMSLLLRCMVTFRGSWKGFERAKPIFIEIKATRLFPISVKREVRWGVICSLLTERFASTSGQTLSRIPASNENRSPLQILQRRNPTWHHTCCGFFLDSHGVYLYSSFLESHKMLTIQHVPFTSIS
jgi:hypothetical protein